MPARASSRKLKMLRILLLFTAAFGVLLSWLLLQQRQLPSQQRSSLKKVSRAQGDLQLGLLHLLLGRDPHGPFDSQKGAALVKQAIDSLREDYQKHGLDPSGLEARVRRWLPSENAGNLPLTTGQLAERLAALHEVTLEIDRLDSLTRDDLARREARLGYSVVISLALGLALFAGACWLILGLVRDERRLSLRLADSDAQLRVVVDNLPDSYLYQYEKAPDGSSRFVYASAGVEGVHGISAEEILKDPGVLLAQLNLEQSRLQAIAEEESARNLSDFQVEFEFRRADGEMRHLRMHSRPRRLADGRILWDGLASDLTRERQAEAKYRGIFENAFEGIYQSSPDGRLLSVNPAMARVFGFSSPEEMLATWKDARHLYADPSQREEYVKLLARDGVLHDFEFQGVRRDGAEIWISTNARVVRNSAGEIMYYEGIGLEVTERRQTLERIRQLNRVYAVHSEINQTIVRGATPEQVLETACAVAVNKGHFQLACVGLLGPGLRLLTRAGGELPLDLFSRAEVCPLLGNALRGEPVVANCLQDFSQIPWAADSLRLGYASAAVLPFQREDQVAGILLLFSAQVGFFDPDETRLLSELTADISFALSAHESECKRRTAEEELRISQEHFRQAQKMEGIGQLAGGVAHDFNNILAVITMQSQLLLEGGDLSQQAAEDVREILSSAEKAANLTRQLLLFSRKQIMFSKDLDLNELIVELASMLRRIIGEDVALELNLHPGQILLHGDPGMLDQVLLNLAVNARDAMPGGGNLTITSKRATLDAANGRPNTSASWAVLSVEDNGCGMHPEVVGRIFEPFFTTKEPGKGTGLGLATVFGIVKQHGGFVEVESSPGQGTSFRVYLPTCEAGRQPEAPTPLPAAERPNGKETVLLVEDDPGVRRLTASVLKSAGYSVLLACDGVEALTVYSKQPHCVDLLLTDMVMPQGVNGRDLAHCCRTRNPNLPVLYMSGYDQAEAGRELRLGPGEAYLQKPFTPPAMLQLVRSCLDERKV